MRKRALKVAGLLKAEISDIIQNKVKDPRLGFVTITDVTITDDLRSAKIYVSVLGSESQVKESMDVLIRATPFVQSELGPRLKLRFIPIIRFFLDESWEYGANIDRLLHELHLDKEE